jgi:hypothetical protein
LRELNRPATDDKHLEENRQWNSLSRMESLGRDSLPGSEGHLSLSRKNSSSQIWDDIEFDIPIIGTLYIN